MNDPQTTVSGQGILKDYYPKGDAPNAMSEALKKKRVKLEESKIGFNEEEEN